MHDSLVIMHLRKYFNRPTISYTYIYDEYRTKKFRKCSQFLVRLLFYFRSFLFEILVANPVSSAREHVRITMALFGHKNFIRIFRQQWIAINGNGIQTCHLNTATTSDNRQHLFIYFQVSMFDCC